MTIENTLRIRLLGPPEVINRGRRMDLGPEREQRLFVALVVARSTPVPDPTVTAWVWDTPAPDAADQLDELAANVRARLAAVGLGDALVRTDGGRLLRIPDDAVDVHRFHRLLAAADRATMDTAVDLLRRAVDLCDGQPLGTLSGARVGDYRSTLLDEHMSARIEYEKVSPRQTHTTGDKHAHGVEVTASEYVVNNFTGGPLGALPMPPRHDADHVVTGKKTATGHRTTAAEYVVNNGTPE
jgi:hypothetical protein